MRAVPAQITDEDRTLVKFYIILPMILTAFERDTAIINNSLKTPDPYIERVHLAMNSLTHDITEIKRQFRDRGIKVYETTREPDGVYTRFLCRGYHGHMTLRWTFIKPEATILMRKYLGLDVSRFENTIVPEWLRIKR
ncbi:hypothetical protein M3231_09340 [Neobacillus mesonae]|nr:hypothetical protein [Neobacillus mesonae]